MLGAMTVSVLRLSTIVEIYVCHGPDDDSCGSGSWRDFSFRFYGQGISHSRQQGRLLAVALSRRHPAGLYCWTSNWAAQEAWLFAKSWSKRHSPITMSSYEEAPYIPATATGQHQQTSWCPSWSYRCISISVTFKQQMQSSFTMSTHLYKFVLHFLYVMRYTFSCYISLHKFVLTSFVISAVTEVEPSEPKAWKEIPRLAHERRQACCICFYYGVKDG